MPEFVSIVMIAFSFIYIEEWCDCSHVKSRLILLDVCFAVGESFHSRLIRVYLADNSFHMFQSDSYCIYLTAGGLLILIERFYHRVYVFLRRLKVHVFLVFQFYNEVLCLTVERRNHCFDLVDHLLTPLFCLLASIFECIAKRDGERISPIDFVLDFILTAEKFFSKRDYVFLVFRVKNVSLVLEVIVDVFNCLDLLNIRVNILRRGLY